MTIPHLAEVAIVPAVAAGGGALVALTFTPTDISTLTIATATLLAAVFSGVALLITTITRARVEQSAVKLAENTKLTQAVQATVGEVAVKVDGQATRADEQIASLQKELQWLRERIGEQKQDAALLAQAKAAPTVTMPVSATNVLNGPEKHLEQINENTKETAANTAKTDASIEAIKQQE